MYCVGVIIPSRSEAGFPEFIRPNIQVTLPRETKHYLWKRRTANWYTMYVIGIHLLSTLFNLTPFDQLSSFDASKNAIASGNRDNSLQPMPTS